MKILKTPGDRKPFRLLLAAVLILSLSCGSCADGRKLHAVKSGKVTAGLSLGEDPPSSAPRGPGGSPFKPEALKSDTLRTTDPDGREILIMRAVRDSATGEMVATDVLQAAVVTARFRHVAERRGSVELSFLISVPDTLLGSRWQLHFSPKLLLYCAPGNAPEDTLTLDPILLTGEEFRRRQLRGYQQYERFLRSIARDSLHFIDTGQLETFLERNIPEVFRFRNDTSLVSDEQFASAFGVTGRQAVEHYTNHLLKRSNARKIRRKGKMWERFVHYPLQKEGIRLDTVLRSPNGGFSCQYTQCLRTRPGLRRADLRLSGRLREVSGRSYGIPESPPLTFYISSLSSFALQQERYLTRVVERRVEADAACHIDFAPGRSEIDLSLNDNALEIGRIQQVLTALLENRDFDLDSTTVVASCSPEGPYESNRALSLRRAEAVSGYFRRFIRHCSDSLEAKRGFAVDERGEIVRSGPLSGDLAGAVRPAGIPDIIHPGNIPEDWDGLARLVGCDTLLSASEKARFERLLRIREPDCREEALRRDKMGPYLLQNLYPRLRRVSFAFHLHRRGMVRDTIHTTVPDTLYRRGLQALKERDYPLALSLLQPYGDLNAAVACLAMDRDASARAILEKLEESASVHYLLALTCTRQGDDARAVHHFLKACRMDSACLHRGNLDPEISELIRRYGLRERLEEEKFE